MKKIIGVLSLLFSVGIVSAQTLTTLAGTGNSGYNGDNIPATTANLYSPLRVIEDNSGNIVIADRSNARVRRIDKVTGLISTVTTDVYTPAALAKDALGNIFVTEEEIGRVRKIDAVTGIVSTVAGSGFNGYGGDGGPASSAILSNPRGIAIANDGTIYIADLSNNRIRKVDATTGIITTIAGTGVGGFSGDGGQAVSAELKFPFDVALDASNNNIYIADGQNSRIRKVNLITGIITTVAGNGVDGSSGDGGLATNAQLGLPMGVFVLGNDNIFIADYSQGRIRVVNKAGIISTVLNNGVGSPSGVIVNSEGSLYIPGAGANRVFKLIPLDSDNDGIFNGIDNCPSSANPGQTDSDGDGSGDACDFEPNDPTKFPGASCTSANECVEAAVYDASGNCVASLFRPAGYVCSTGQCNGLGTCAPPDTDGDGVPDSSDNCPSRANTNQTDSDGDGRGDVCDNCPSVANPDQLDTNGNGEGDACESSVRVKINEIYGAGGFNGASYINDFVELYNASSSAIDLQGLSLQYSTANGSSWQAISLSGSIAPYGYFLIELGSNGPNGESLPTADLVVPVLNLAPTAGKLALVNGEELLIESCPTGSQIIDFVGYHPLANCFEGLNAPFNHLVISIERMVAGQDTNNNSFDFMNTSPPTPQHGLFVADADNDGVPDSSDNCPSTENADQADGDNDAIGDVCDACPADANNDTDDDGFCDNLDFAPNDPTKYPGAPCGSQNGCSISSGYDAFGNCMVVYLPAGTACSTGECDGAGNCSTINSAPTLPASNITFTNIFSDRMQINFIPGNGENRLLVMRQGSPVSWTPVDGEDYETSESFSEATDLGDGNKVVTPNAAGLLPSTTYYVKVFEFSGTGALTQYLLTGAPVAIKKTTPLPNVYVSSPVNNAINQKWNLNITARTVTGAITYTIELNKNADFIGESIIQSGARTQTFNGLEFGATYFTRVKTELRPEYGKVTHFTVATPAYYSYVYTPANGAINQKVSLNIVSNLVPDATEYTIQISPEDDFSSDVIERTGPTRSLAFSGLSYNTIYHTQVRTNLSPEFGQVRSFTTRTAESLAYVTSPANGAVDRKTKLNITSNPVPGATSYTIQLSEDEEFGEIAFEATGPTRTRSFSGLTPGTKYYNRVTTDAPGTVGFGQVRNFTTAGIPPGARLSSTTTLGDPVETGELMEFDVRVYPNPFHEKLIFHIEARVAQQATVTLMDVNGKAVHESVEQTNATIEIEKPLTAGVYLLRVKAGSQYKMIRVVKSD